MAYQLRSMLETVSDELLALARIAADVQGASLAQPLGRTCGALGPAQGLGSSPGDDEFITALQSLDYLTQALQCLARFVGASAEVAPSCTADFSEALGTVWLAELAARLEGRELSLPVAGELELFEAG